MRRTLALLMTLPGLTAVTALALAPPGAAEAAATTCEGVPATVAGAGEDRLDGTVGDDVIVTNGASLVVAGAGDDLICVTGAPGEPDGPTEVYADEDDDRVVVLTGVLDAGRANRIDLGGGDNELVGGPGADVVDGGSDFNGRNVVDTGGGFDEFHVSQGDNLVHDEIHLGADGGTVTGYATGMASDGVLDGGDGGVWALTTPGEDWVVDNAAGTASVGGDRRFAWTGFDTFVWADDGTLTFVGTGRDEVVTGPLVSAATGGGDDVVYARMEVTDDGRSIDLRGGTGDDRVSFERTRGRTVATSLLRLDLPAHEVVDGSRLVVATFGAFEAHGAISPVGRVTVLGTGGADRLFAQGCRLTVDGGAGADRISSVAFVAPRRCPGGTVGRFLGGAGADRILGGTRPMVVLAGSGADRVTGSSQEDVLRGQGGDDVLLGGAARRDRADGGPGRDRCVAERRTACER